MARYPGLGHRRRGKKVDSDPVGFAKDLRTWLNQLYILADNGCEVKGQSMSYLISNLRGYDGWQIPRLYEFISEPPL